MTNIIIVNLYEIILMIVQRLIEDYRRLPGKCLFCGRKASRKDKSWTLSWTYNWMEIAVLKNIEIIAMQSGCSIQHENSLFNPRWSPLKSWMLLPVHCNFILLDVHNFLVACWNFFSSIVFLFDMETVRINLSVFPSEK